MTNTQKAIADEIDNLEPGQTVVFTNGHSVTGLAEYECETYDVDGTKPLDFYGAYMQAMK